jgi:hypothetical protein
MAIEYKYGRVTLERGSIGEDEPVVVFRAQDRMLGPLLTAYKKLCLDAGSPPEHLSRITETQRKIMDWQGDRPTLTKVPD